MKGHAGVFGPAGLVAVMLVVGLRPAAVQPGPDRGPGMGGPAQTFGQIDKNDDGKVTKDEVADWTCDRYSRAEGYIDYLNKLLPKVRSGGLIIAHNMNPRQADPNYTKAITTNPDLETLFLLMDGSGVGVTMKRH